MPIEITQVLSEAYAVAMGSNEEATRSVIVVYFVYEYKIKYKVSSVLN
jgi:hypothetical protein